MGRSRMAALTHNTTFSGHFALPNFGHPFMFSAASTCDSEMARNRDESAISNRFAERQFLTATAVPEECAARLILAGRYLRRGCNAARSPPDKGRRRFEPYMNSFTQSSTCGWPASARRRTARQFERPKTSPLA